MHPALKQERGEGSEEREPRAPVFFSRFSLLFPLSCLLAADPAPIPRHLPHVRVAALAYAGNPVGPFEKRLLRDAIDLVVPNPQLLPAVRRAAPDTPAVIYTNVSNLYRELLLDWIDFADRHGHDREAAFFHVAKPTHYRGMSASSIPADWFWQAVRDDPGRGRPPLDLTTACRDPKSHGVVLPSSGRLTLGHPERFDEVRVTVVRPGSGYAPSWEYSTADGWKPLEVTDGTGGGAKSGSVTFEPPADWKPARAGKGPRLYHVRLTGRGGTPPAATSVKARDYAANGTIPAFDAAADADGNGHLSDAEYARRQPGHDARFRHESRLFYPYYGPNRFAVRPSPAVRAWAGDYHRRFLAAHPLAGGLFIDNTGGRPPLDGAAVTESVAAYADDAAAVLAAVRDAVAPKLVLANAGGTGPAVDKVLSQVPVAMEEFAMRPLAHHHGQFRDVAAMTEARLRVTPMLVLDSLPAGGSPTDPRTQLATLAYYYLLADPERTFVMFYGGFEPATTWARHWVPAVTHDVGRPKGKWQQREEGTDPVDPALAWHLLAREYDKALVLYKPLSYSRGKRPGGTGDATATHHELGGRYRPLHADGAVGEPVERVTLRNGEGAVLLRE